MSTSVVDRKLYELTSGRYGIDNRVIDDKIKRIIFQLPEESVMTVLAEFEMALRTNRDNIRNPQAYLMGMLTKSKIALELPLRPRVKRRLEEILRHGVWKIDEMDIRCIDSLNAMAENDALRILDELDAGDRTRIKNVTGFLVSTIKKYKPDYDDAPSHNSAAARLQQSYPPAPSFIPPELYFGTGDNEYIPQMPNRFERMGLPARVCDLLLSATEKGIVTNEELDDRLLKEIASCTEPVALHVAKEVSGMDRSAIRSIPSYINGIIKRQKQHQPQSSFRSAASQNDDYYRSAGSYSGGSGSGDSGGEMAGRSKVEFEIRRNVLAGLITDSDIDDRTRDFLASQPTKIAIRAITDFSAKDMKRIRDKSSFMRGIVRNATIESKPF